MLASQPWMVPVAFNQTAGVDRRPGLLTSFAASTCQILLGQIGRKTTIRWILAAVVLLVAPARSEAACLDPETSSHMTVSITRYFDEEERQSQPNALGIHGAGWFVSPRAMVTVAHVADAMHLSTEDWKDIEIRDRQNKRSVAVRLSWLAGAQSEKIAVLELKTPISDARFLSFRMEPLAVNERVMSVAYVGDRLRVVDGRFVEYGANNKFTGAALFELYDGDDRLALDHGASGTPILDCQGRVVAVVSNILTRTMQFLSTVRVVSTAWGQPNVVSVPIQMLTDFSGAE